MRRLSSTTTGANKSLILVNRPWIGIFLPRESIKLYIGYGSAAATPQFWGWSKQLKREFKKISCWFHFKLHIEDVLCQFPYICYDRLFRYGGRRLLSDAVHKHTFTLSSSMYSHNSSQLSAQPIHPHVYHQILFYSICWILLNTIEYSFIWQFSAQQAVPNTLW